MIPHRPISSSLLLLSLLAGTVPLHSAIAGDAASPEIAVSSSPEPSEAYLTITDIGTIADRGSVGTAINSAGEVAGRSHFAGTVGVLGGAEAVPFLSHAVLYTDGALWDLGALEGYETCSPLGCESLGLGINESRWIVGENDGDYGPMAVLWLPEAVPGAVEGWNVLPPLAPDQSARALAVDDSGQIVGLAVVDNIHRRAVRWVVLPNGPAVADLGTLRADGSGESLASDINDLGQIAGFAQDESGFRKPFLYLPSPAYGLPVGMHNLMPDLDGDVEAAYVNDKGEVACGLDLGVPGLWLPAPAHGFPAGFSLLPLTGHVAAFFPSSISEAGQIAGSVYIVKSPGTRDYEQAAVVWRSGQYRVLNEMLPPGSPWDLRQANGIVRIGKTTLVTGHGRRDDITDINGFPASHGFVLSVTCTGDLDDDGDVDQDDQKILMSYFGEEVPPGTDADLNHDGVVDDADIRLLARQIERPCL